MAEMARGEVAITMAKHRPDTPFEKLGVPDSKYNRELWGRVAEEMRAMEKKGLVPSIPWDPSLD